MGFLQIGKLVRGLVIDRAGVHGEIRWLRTLEFTVCDSGFGVPELRV